ncbi:trigger factor [Chitinophaga costaii]|uniref:Trigger factor n=1 Tax=Chitinophaga costaii TaxID=1335309 RepID=A0A1C4F331_9BACT|nr:trigger factor [Chitinophaga costaii]PUZ22118.1 trigger factor [Chitinophaga costaii]SCC50145.1 trigger factor [Chitinophaga costaii]
MATVTRENIGLLNDKITVKVNQEDYLPNFDKAVKQFSKTANIPGFRKGMVPAGMVKKMHGQAIFTDEVIKAVEAKLGNYMQEEKLDIFGQPIPLERTANDFDFNTPSEYSFNFEIGLKPAIEVTPLENGKTNLTRYKIKVSDKMVDEEVERMQLKGGNITDGDTITDGENVVNVTFEETDANGNVIEGGIKKDNSLLVKYFSPAIVEKLKGKKTGDSIVFQLESSFDAERLAYILKDLGLDADDAAAAKKYFKLDITKVQVIEKKELNEAFFKEVYPNDNLVTVEDFRNKLKSEIETYWAQESRNTLHNELFEILVHETPIDLPKAFLKRWLQVGGEKPKTADEAEREYPNFDHQLRWTLISDKLIRDNNMEVSFEELKEAAKTKLLGHFGGAAVAGAEWLDSYLDNLLRDEKFVDQTYREMITQKLFDYAETKVNIKEEEISAEEFVKLPNKHHHHHEH